MNIKVTWIGGPQDGGTFTIDERRAPYVLVPEYSFMPLRNSDPGLSANDEVKIRRVFIDKRVDNFYDDDGVFEYAKMYYVAEYDKGLVT